MLSERHILAGVSVISVEDESIGLHWSALLQIELELWVVSLVDEEIAIGNLERERK